MGLAIAGRRPLNRVWLIALGPQWYQQVDCRCRLLASASTRAAARRLIYALNGRGILPRIMVIGRFRMPQPVARTMPPWLSTSTAADGPIPTTNGQTVPSAKASPVSNGADHSNEWRAHKNVRTLSFSITMEVARDADANMCPCPSRHAGRKSFRQVHLQFALCGQLWRKLGATTIFRKRRADETRHPPPTAAASDPTRPGDNIQDGPMPGIR